MLWKGHYEKHDIWINPEVFLKAMVIHLFFILKYATYCTVHLGVHKSNCPSVSAGHTKAGRFTSII